MIWAAVATLAGLSALWLVWPALRTTVLEGGSHDAAVSIYTDQVGEVARDRDRGLISMEEAKAAIAEIEWRKSRALRQLSTGFSVAHRSPLGAGIMALVLIAAAVGGYLATGTPDAGDRPLAARTTEQLEQRAAGGDLTARIQLLIERTEEDPESFEAWWILARSHAAVGDHAASAEAYRRAVLLRGDDPGVLSAYAEAMTLANGNKVPDGAEIIFAQVARETADPRALYYLALARAQRQDFEGALQDWTALAQGSDANAPWMPLVRRDIVNMARFLKVDVVAYLPDATATEIATAQGLATPEHDIEALKAALADDPTDYESWMRLVQAEMDAGNTDGAAAAIAEARVAFRGAPFLLQKISETERALGLDLVAEAPRGPSAADIASASEMSPDDRNAMVRGMVEGLAERLKEQPNDPEGWAMLIRSYGVLGDPDAAEEARAQAVAALGPGVDIDALVEGR